MTETLSTPVMFTHSFRVRFIDFTKSLYPVVLFVSCILVIFILNYLWRFPYIKNFGLLNEDAALLLGVRTAFSEPGWYLQIFKPYGPHVIRPFQLVGMYIEGTLLSLLPSQMILMSVAFLSLGQSILIWTLKPIAGWFGACVTALAVGISVYSAEPVLWLSARHDLYLFIFGGLSLYVHLKILSRENSSSAKSNAYLALIIVANCCASLSNEKGTALPLMFCLAVFIIPAISVKWKDKIRIIAANAMSFVIYFAFRYSLLGSFIGGYDNEVFPNSIFTGTNIISVIFGLLALPFRSIAHQNTALLYLLVGSGLLIVLAVMFFNLGALSTSFAIVFRNIIISILLLFCASVPTLKYMLPNFGVGLLNIRMFWLPWVTYSVLLGILFGLAFKENASIFSRVLTIICASLFLCGIGTVGKESIQSYGLANTLRSNVMAMYKELCYCHSSKLPQILELPHIFHGINAFNGPKWVEKMAFFEGLPSCPGEMERSCRVKVAADFTNGRISFWPLYINPNTRKRFSISPRKRWKKYKVKSFVRTFSIIRGTSMLKIEGWAVNDIRPVNEILIMIDNKAFLRTLPNVRSKEVETKFKLPNDKNYGFDLEIDTSEFKDGTHKVEVLALKRTAKGDRVYTMYAGKLTKTCSVRLGDKTSCTITAS